MMITFGGPRRGLTMSSPLVVFVSLEAEECMKGNTDHLKYSFFFIILFLKKGFAAIIKFQDHIRFQIVSYELL